MLGILVSFWGFLYFQVSSSSALEWDTSLMLIAWSSTNLNTKISEKKNEGKMMGSPLFSKRKNVGTLAYPNSSLLRIFHHTISLTHSVYSWYMYFRLALQANYPPNVPNMFDKHCLLGGYGPPTENTHHLIYPKKNSRRMHFMWPFL